MSSRSSEQTPPDAELFEELLPEAPPLEGGPLDEDVEGAEDEAEVHPAGRLSYRYLQSSIGLRVAALAGIAMVVGMGLGTDGWGGSTCC